MRLLIVLFVIVVLMVLGGWIVFDVRNNSATIEVQTEKIQQDTSQAVEQASDSLRKAGESIKRP